MAFYKRKGLFLAEFVPLSYEFFQFASVGSYYPHTLHDLTCNNALIIDLCIRYTI